MDLSVYEAMVRNFDVQMDQAVQEVFAMMLGVQCIPDSESRAAAEPEGYPILITLAGIISGFCILHADKLSSHSLTQLLTGEEEPGEETVKDALGEVCNMVAGAWKSCVPDLASGCTLSPPSVLSKQDYVLRSRPGCLGAARYYRFSDAGFTFTIQCSS